MKSVARDHCKSSDVYCFLFLRMNSPNFFLAQPTHSHVLSHGVFHAWTASCEFGIFCLCGHVWDVKSIWTKFLSADEIGGKRLQVLRCLLSPISSHEPATKWKNIIMAKHRLAYFIISSSAMVCSNLGLYPWIGNCFASNPRETNSWGFLFEKVIPSSKFLRIGSSVNWCATALEIVRKPGFTLDFQRKITKCWRPSHMCFGDLTPPQLVFPAKFDGV